MRYLRDIGVDARLFIYKGEFNHFHPQCDTFEYTIWRDFITELPIRNNPKDVLKIRNKTLKKIFTGFDVFIGCGYSPAILNKIDLTVNIFIPYSNLLDGFAPNNFLKYFLSPHWVFYLLLGKYLQVNAIRKCNYITTLPILKERNNLLAKMKIPKSKILYTNIPMVYNKENNYKFLPGISEECKSILVRIKKVKPVIISHTRHEWKNPQSGFRGKGNDILIRGFAKYINKSQNREALLVLFEYGPDINESRILINKLNIGPNVLWSPLLPRKEIQILIAASQFGADQFIEKFWGGVGWEILSKGVPLFNNYIDNDYFNKKLYNDDFPPIIKVDSYNDISEHLLDYDLNPEKYIALGKKSVNWFNKNAGENLAITFKKLIYNIFCTK